MKPACTYITAVITFILASLSPSFGADCPIGPIAVNAPTCNIAQGEHLEGKMSYLEWKKDNISYVVTVINVNQSQNFKKFMSRWRHSHKCAIKALSLTHPVKMGTTTPPQVSFKGNCAGGESFILQAIKLKKVWVEVQVFTNIHNSPTPESFVTLLEAIHLSEPK